MTKFKEIKPAYAEKGDILVYIRHKYIEFDGGAWNTHFANVKCYGVLAETPPNNGVAKVKHPGTGYHYISLFTDDRIRVYRNAERHAIPAYELV